MREAQEKDRGIEKMNGFPQLLKNIDKNRKKFASANADTDKEDVFAVRESCKVNEDDR